LLSEFPSARGIGADVSEAALRVARANAASNGLADRARFLAADWTSGLRGSFDVVVSNPPYIADGEIETLAPEVRTHDPRLALAGGPDGLSAYRKFVPCLRSLVDLDGFVVLEVGPGQAAAVVQMAQNAGFIHIGSQYDLAGIERAVVLQPRHGPPC
jgi:release factor glutamine methyltransferase